MNFSCERQNGDQHDRPHLHEAVRTLEIKWFNSSAIQTVMTMPKIVWKTSGSLGSMISNTTRPQTPQYVSRRSVTIDKDPDQGRECKRDNCSKRS
jgi:hypothetical protein